MIVTINTDASVVEGCGGYAFWIVCDAGKIQKAGHIKTKITSSLGAEIFSIGNAIYTLLHSKFTEVTKVIVNTDSIGAIDILAGHVGVKPTSVFYKAVEETRFNMIDVCIKNGMPIRDVKKVFEFRHVKAHTKASDARSFVNNWCDKESRKYARKLYKENKNTL